MSAGIFFKDELNVIVGQVSCVPEANGSAATDFAPEPNGEAAAPPKGEGEEVDAVFFASPNGLAAQRTVVSLLSRHRYPSRKPERAPRHVKVIIILSLLREPLFYRRWSSQFSFSSLIRFLIFPKPTTMTTDVRGFRPATVQFSSQMFGRKPRLLHSVGRAPTTRIRRLRQSRGGQWVRAHEARVRCGVYRCRVGSGVGNFETLLRGW